MPRGTYHLKLEMLQPLDWPGQPDATGTLDLRIPLNTVWKGYGPVLVSGVVQSSLLKQPEVLADLQVTLNEQRAVSVPVDTKKASGTVNVFFLSDMATAAVHAVLTGKTGAFRGVTFKLEGEATIDQASIQEWDAPISDATVPDIDQQLPAAPVVPYTGPILYLPANCGWYNGGEAFGEILRWLATYRGRVGLGLEFTGSTGNLGVNTVDWRGAYQAHALKAVAVVSAAAAAGVPTKGDGINTNDFGKGWSAGWKDTPANRAAVLVITKQLAEGLLPLAAWCTIQPYSESKDWMPADFRRAVFDAWVKAGWSKARLCGGGIAETHTGKLEALKPPALAATDNGPAIEAHFGKGVWTAHTPHIARCSAYAKHYLGRGVHASLYHRADRLHLLEHRAAYDAIITAATGWRDSSPVAPPSSDGTPGAAMIFRYVGGGQRDVSWAPAVDRSGWPTKSVGGATCDGLLYGARVGEESRKIEWIKRGQQSAHTKNAWAFAKDRKYNQGWAGGERVRLEIRDVAGNAKGHGGEVVLA